MMMTCFVLLVGRAFSASNCVIGSTSELEYGDDSQAVISLIEDESACNLVIGSGHYNGLKESGTKVLVIGGVVKLGEGCLQGLSDLTTIHLGKDVAAIDANAFYGCTSLESFSLGVPGSADKPGACFVDAAGGLYVRLTDTTCVFQAYPAAKDPGNAGTYTISATADSRTVKEIVGGAFAYSKYIKNIVIPGGTGGVGYAGAGSFSHMSALNVVRWSGETGTGKVDGTESKYLNIQNELVISSDGTNIYVLVYMAAGAQSEDDKKEVVIPVGVNYVCSGVFVNCEKLEKVTFPENSAIAGIGEGAFANCTKLKTFVVTTTSNKVAVSGTNLLLSCGVGTCETDLTASSNWILIAAATGALTEADDSLTIPNGVKKIGELAFSGASKVVDIELGTGVADVADGAFVGATSLETITNGIATGNVIYVNARVVAVPPKIATAPTLAGAVTSIAPFAFAGYQKTTVTFNTNGAVTVEANAFSGSKLQTIITGVGINLAHDALNGASDLKQIHFTTTVSANSISCGEIGDSDLIFSAGSSGWLCARPVFAADTATGAISAPTEFNLSRLLQDDATITSPSNLPSTIVGNLRSGYGTLRVKGVKLSGDVTLGTGARIVSDGKLDLGGKVISFVAEYAYDDEDESGRIHLNTGSIETSSADSKQVKVQIGKTVARLYGEDLASLNVNRLISGTFADDGACKAKLSNIELSTALETDVEFSVECSQRAASSSVGLNEGEVYDIVLVGKDPKAGETSAQPGGGNGGGDDDKGLSAGAVAGIVIGVAVVVGLASALIVYFVMSRKQRVNEEKEGST